MDDKRKLLTDIQAVTSMAQQVVTSEVKDAAPEISEAVEKAANEFVKRIHNVVRQWA